MISNYILMVINIIDNYKTKILWIYWMLIIINILYL